MFNNWVLGALSGSFQIPNFDGFYALANCRHHLTLSGSPRVYIATPAKSGTRIPKYSERIEEIKTTLTQIIPILRLTQDFEIFPYPVGGHTYNDARWFEHTAHGKVLTNYNYEVGNMMYEYWNEYRHVPVRWNDF